jgi:hypothetical protein
MQAVAKETEHANSQPRPLVITWEAIAIVVLVIISLTLRLAELGAYPLAENETRQALSSWRSVHPHATGSAITSSSSVLFWTQQIAFSTAGGSEINARIFTAIAGVLLGISPLLFRSLLGRTRAYFFAVLLTLSPVLLVASRFGSGAIWTLLFAAVGLWAVYQYWKDARKGYGLTAMIAFSAMLLLSEPGGIVTGLILLGAGAAALSLSTLDAPEESGVPGDDFLAGVRDRFRIWPWLAGAGGAALVIIAFSTGFLVKPGGLSMIGALLEGFFAGFTSPSQANAPLLWPLAVSVFYEPWLWVFGVVGLVLVYRRGEIDFVERFLLAWAVLGTSAALIYRGADAAHALWLTVPLAGLASYAASDLLTADDDTLALWIDDLFDDAGLQASTARWGKWLLAVLAAGLVVMAALHFQIISRGFLEVPGGAVFELVSRLGEQAMVNVINSFIWLTIAVLFLVVGYFLAASVWGNITAARGGAVGLLLFAVLTSLGSGWNAATTNADNPREIWRVQAPGPDAFMLRWTMGELSFRHSEGFPVLPVVVIGPDDGLVAWALRDYTRTRFTSEVADARTEQIIVTPGDMDSPDLGGSYVGQRFLLTQRWSPASLVGLDFLPWWSARATRVAPEPAEVIILWVRQDIFDGRPFQSGRPGE